MNRIAAAIGDGVVAVVGWPQAAGAIVYNAASVIRGGRIERTCRKHGVGFREEDARSIYDAVPGWGPSFSRTRERERRGRHVRSPRV